MAGVIPVQTYQSFANALAAALARQRQTQEAMAEQSAERTKAKSQERIARTQAGVQKEATRAQALLGMMGLKSQETIAGRAAGAQIATAKVGAKTEMERIAATERTSEKQIDTQIQNFNKLLNFKQLTLESEDKRAERTAKIMEEGQRLQAELTSRGLKVQAAKIMANLKMWRDTTDIIQKTNLAPNAHEATQTSIARASEILNAPNLTYSERYEAIMAVAENLRKNKGAQYANDFLEAIKAQAPSQAPVSEWGRPFSKEAIPFMQWLFRQRGIGQMMDIPFYDAPPVAPRPKGDEQALQNLISGLGKPLGLSYD